MAEQQENEDTVPDWTQTFKQRRTLDDDGPRDSSYGALQGSTYTAPTVKRSATVDRQASNISNDFYSMKRNAALMTPITNQLSLELMEDISQAKKVLKKMFDR